MPSPLSSGIYWASFMTFLALRRESFVRFLEDNDATLSFDKRYVDLFFNELGLAFMAEGIQAIRLPYRRIFCDRSLAQILLKLHGHCDSDHDVWAAITSGCFRADSISDDDCTGAVTGWWESTLERPTFDSVVAEWESAMLDAAANAVPRSGVQTAAQAQALFQEIIETIQSDVNRTLDITNAVRDTFTEVAKHSQTWDIATRRI